MTSSPTVAVIGAGIAGLSCARGLTEGGATVTVFDKGRGVAGRTSTRRTDADPARGWDHGAICFLAEDETFLAEMARWLDAGIVAPWPVAPAAPGEAELDPRELLTPDFSSSWVGVPSMSAIARHLAHGLDVRCAHRVTHLRREHDGWFLQIDTPEGAKDEGPFDELVLTAPPPQSRALLEEVDRTLAELLVQPWIHPSWALLAVTDPIDAPIPIRRVGPGHLPDGVASLVCEDSKPGRKPHPDGMRWLLQTTAGWAQQHLELDADAAQALLVQKLEEALGIPVRSAQAHHWRYARVHRPLGRDCLREAEARITLAGDFCRGDGVENAWLSGRAAAQAIWEA